LTLGELRATVAVRGLRVNKACAGDKNDQTH
jgi:hypothetical protein